MQRCFSILVQLVRRNPRLQEQFHQTLVAGPGGQMQWRPTLGPTFGVHPLRQQKFHHAAVIEARGCLQGGLLVLALGRIDQVGAVDQHPPQSLQLP